MRLNEDLKPVVHCQVYRLQRKFKMLSFTPIHLHCWTTTSRYLKKSGIRLTLWYSGLKTALISRKPMIYVFKNFELEWSIESKYLILLHHLQPCLKAWNGTLHYSHTLFAYLPQRHMWIWQIQKVRTKNRWQLTCCSPAYVANENVICIATSWKSSIKTNFEYTYHLPNQWHQICKNWSIMPALGN